MNLTFSIISSNSQSNRLTIFSDGSIGIGTISPSEKLNIRSSKEILLEQRRLKLQKLDKYIKEQEK